MSVTLTGEFLSKVHEIKSCDDLELMFAFKILLNFMKMIYLYVRIFFLSVENYKV